jgi:uncharacterized membrane protein
MGIELRSARETAGKSMQQDPYVAPVSQATDPAVAGPGYVEGGRSVPAAHGVEWLTTGWRLFRRQAGIWILLTLAFGLIVVALLFVPFIGSLAVTLSMPVFVGGVMRGCRKIESGDDLELADLFAGFRHNTGNLVLVGVIGLALSIVVVIPATFIVVFIFGTVSLGAIMAGNPAAMGPGALIGPLVFLALLVPVNMALWFAPVLVALHGESATRAIAQSFKACLRNIAAFLVYGAILIVLAIMATILAGLGWLVLIPVLVGSVYAAYRDIFLT